MRKQFGAALESLRRQMEEDSSAGSHPRLLVAVSGGVDSMCLADLMYGALVDFAVAHCNFHLRGQESDSDAALVRRWCSDHGVRLHYIDFDTESFAGENGLSIEMAARELRYRWFAGLCEENSYAGVAVAHNANDNVETLFLNLLRGTGLKGLAGMQPVSRIPYSDDSLRARLYRPLLQFTRKQIEGHVRARSVPFHEDSTNSDTTYKRNRIRHSLFPLMEKINPSFIATIGREMGYFAQAHDIISDIGASLKLVSEGENGQMTIDVERLLSIAHWPYFLYGALEPFGFGSATVSSLEKLLKDADATFSGKTFSSPTHILVTAQGKLILQPAVGVSAQEGVTVTGPGEYEIDSVKFSVEVLPPADLPSLKCPAGTVLLDAAALPFPFVCRKWRKGDWLRPLGMKGQKKKVSDVFTDLKTDALSKKRELMIVREAEDSHILAMLGGRIDESVKITLDTALAVRIILRSR